MDLVGGEHCQRRSGSDAATSDLLMTYFVFRLPDVAVISPIDDPLHDTRGGTGSTIQS